MALALSTISDTTTAFNTATSALALTLTGIVGTITLEGASYNTTVVPSANIVFGGSGSSRTVTVTPATGQSGLVTISITATDDDDDQPVTTSFLLTVSPASATDWTPPSGWEAQQVGAPSEFTRAGEKRTLVYSAPYPAAETDKPADGATVSGYTGVIVQRVSIEPLSAETDNGLCTVTIELGSAETGSGSGTEDPQPTYTRRWDQLEKPLLTHPRYQTGGASTLTNLDLAQIETWRDETDTALKAAFKFISRSPATLGTELTLSDEAQNAAKKILKGVETWQCPVPVVSMTSFVTSRPLAKTSMSKHFSAPPGFPSGTFPTLSARGLPLRWFGIADEANRQGRSGLWVQTVSYQGVEGIDSDLYPAG
jgi:hypothetical protein